jgi:monoamine oxidase
MTDHPREHRPPITRRQLLTMIGTAAGGAAMYQAMETLGFAAQSTFREPIRLEGSPRDASVLILGAGLAGMVAAMELRKAGYRIQILEYQNRPGGRCWSVRGGDRFTELGGFEQTCAFDKDQYMNVGPWRIPYHHRGVLHYCKQLGVALEPFIQVNYNAYMHAENAFAGKPQRFRQFQSDFHGGVAELLAKVVNADRLDEPLSKEDKELLLNALRQFGALDANFKYTTGAITSDRRGFDRDPGGGLSAEPAFSAPQPFAEILRSRAWQRLAVGSQYEYQPVMFQPVGGMDMIGKAFARQVSDLIQFNAKVKSIQQSERKVEVGYIDTKTGAAKSATADWCLCTLPLTVLGQIDMNVGAPMAQAIRAVPYTSSIKVGLQFKRRFWEQDESIFGGITYTDLPISLISYPSANCGSDGKGVLLGAYVFGVYALEFTSLPPAERIQKAFEYGARIHPQYKTEYENGFTVGWHRVPWTLGCAGSWTADARRQHYANLCAIDGRIALAGEHASYIPAWQEGAILSSLDAIDRLHRRVLAT